MSLATKCDLKPKSNESEPISQLESSIDHWRATELRRAPSSTYMSKQQDINPKMREILVDWMGTCHKTQNTPHTHNTAQIMLTLLCSVVFDICLLCAAEVQLKFKLKEETLFLSVHILDRFLECTSLASRYTLQLVGCSALWVASKYEEIYTPDANNFIAISDKAYTREQLLTMEGTLLTALSFDLVAPLPTHFLQRFANICDVQRGDQVWQFSMYFMELTLQNYSFLAFLPSQIAASAIYLAMGSAQGVQGQGHLPVWTVAQQSRIKYTQRQISECIRNMYNLIKASQEGLFKYRAVKRKYSLPQYLQISKYTCRPPLDSALE